MSLRARARRCSRTWSPAHAHAWRYASSAASSSAVDMRSRSTAPCRSCGWIRPSACVVFSNWHCSMAACSKLCAFGVQIPS